MGICTTKRIFNSVISFEVARIKCKNLCRVQWCALRFFFCIPTYTERVFTGIDCTSSSSGSALNLINQLLFCRLSSGENAFVLAAGVCERVYCLCENAVAAHGRLIKRARGSGRAAGMILGRSLARSDGRPGCAARVFVLCERAAAHFLAL
jgi:hypothetical protein